MGLSAMQVHGRMVQHLTAISVHARQPCVAVITMLITAVVNRMIYITVVLMAADVLDAAMPLRLHALGGNAVIHVMMDMRTVMVIGITAVKSI